MHYKVSVVILSYNQEKYIEKAIQSVLMQKTDFPFEILLGDDCSTDGTEKIVHAYSDKIHIYCREHNIGGTKNHYDLLMRTKGEYITILEGDDYWIGENRLQVLADFLDLHPEYIAVGHTREVRNTKGELIGHEPNNQDSIECRITRNSVLFGEKKLAVSALMYRNIFKNSKGKYGFIPTVDRHQDDIVIAQLLLAKGNAYNLNKCLGCYVFRRNTQEANFNSLYSEEEQLRRLYHIHQKTAEFLGEKNMYDYNEAIRGCAILLSKLRHGKIRDFFRLAKIMGLKRIINMIRFIPIKILKKMNVLEEDAMPYHRIERKG